MIRLRKDTHPNLHWWINHLTHLYIALIVSIILPLVVVEVFFK